jgi:cytochrome c
MRGTRATGGLQAAAIVALLALLALPAAPARAGDADGAHGDAAAGAQAFLLCSACHSATPDAAALIGPNLWGVVGRPVGSAPGFDYSEGLRAIGGSWTPELLDRFLSDPAALAPGTRMGIAGVADRAERANLVAYLQALHDGAGAVGAAPAVDYGPDWPAGPGQAEAGQLCNACHSLTLVKQQKLSRATWDKLLVWMVEEQGMAEQPPEARERILDYLATHFGAPD